MKKSILSLLLTFNIYAIAPDELAPNFTLINQDGQEITLSQFKGKRVVLEWYNHGCPFVRKHYDTKNMQKTQEIAKQKGYIWLTISSSNIDKQGYLPTTKSAKDRLWFEKSNATHLLIDTNGIVGNLYNAKTTPEIFLVSKSGHIEYMGAIDNIPSAEHSDISKAQNYVLSAINDLESGKKIKVARTKSYGCSIKY